MKKERKIKLALQQPPKTLGEKSPEKFLDVKMLKRSQVLKMCGFSKSTLRKIMKQEFDLFDPSFPKPFVYGPDPFTKRHKYWHRDKIEAWISTKAEKAI